MEKGEVEVKVVYREIDDSGEINRVLHGFITKEDEHFIWLNTNYGIFRIGKSHIIKIKEGNDG